MIYRSPVSAQRGSWSNLNAEQILAINSRRYPASYILGPFIDESKLAQETDKTSVLEFTRQLRLERVGVPVNQRFASVNRAHYRSPPLKKTGVCSFVWRKHELTVNSLEHSVHLRSNNSRANFLKQMLGTLQSDLVSLS